jgi:hypothetical protein
MAEETKLTGEKFSQIGDSAMALYPLCNGGVIV